MTTKEKLMKLCNEVPNKYDDFISLMESVFHDNEKYMQEMIDFIETHPDAGTGDVIGQLRWIIPRFIASRGGSTREILKLALDQTPDAYEGFSERVMGELKTGKNMNAMINFIWHKDYDMTTDEILAEIPNICSRSKTPNEDYVDEWYTPPKRYEPA